MATRRTPAARAWAAPTATVLNTQNPIAHHVLDRLDRRAGRTRGDVVRRRRGVGVGVERDGETRRRGDLADVRRRMDALEFLVGRGARVHDSPTARPPAARHDLHHLRPLDALGMPRRREVIGETSRMDQDQRHETYVGRTLSGPPSSIPSALVLSA